MRIPFALPLSILALGAAFALPARAEEGQESDLEKKLKEQMQKVLRLMQENEDALLKASTQGGSAPKGPDVPLPPPGQGSAGAGSQGGQGGGGQGAGQGGQGAGQGGQAGQGGGRGGEGAKAALDELLKALQEGGGAIPGEIENLIKMIPT